jgi:hypothetical protein
MDTDVQEAANDQAGKNDEDRFFRAHN